MPVYANMPILQILLDLTSYYFNTCIYFLNQTKHAAVSQVNQVTGDGS